MHERRQVLDGEDLKEKIIKMMDSVGRRFNICLFNRRKC